MKIDVSFVAFHSQKQVCTFIQRAVYSFEKRRVKAYCEGLCQVLYTLSRQRGSCRRHLEQRCSSVRGSPVLPLMA